MKKTIITLKLFLKIFLIYFSFFLLIANINAAKISARNGLILCADIIIPSLFPFLVCTLLMSKNNIFEALPFPKKIKHLQIIFKIFLLSNSGGYPIGAKIITEEFLNKRITVSDARRLILSSINPGPAFSILVVGCGIFNSLKLGIIFYISQFFSSLLILIFISKDFSKETINIKIKHSGFIENFISSVSDSSSAMLNMCGYIIICATALGILNSCNINPIINSLMNYSLEISNAILSTKNIYIMAGILGFGSFSIIFQVMSICRPFSPNIYKIIFSRFINSFLSAFITFIFLKLFPIKINTISNSKNLILNCNNNSVILTVLLIITIFTLIYSLSTKKYCGKITDDIF